jgi:hypothetical protein
MPFIESIREHDAAPVAVSGAKGGLLGDGFGASIDHPIAD